MYPILSHSLAENYTIGVGITTWTFMEDVFMLAKGNSIEKGDIVNCRQATLMALGVIGALNGKHGSG